MDVRELLRWRADALRSLREHLWSRGYREADPLLAQGAACVEPHLDGPRLQWKHVRGRSRRFLPTSPELGLKRMLSEGMGDVFALQSAFRDEMEASLHAPEFLMLEWYRLDGDLAGLVEEAAGVIRILAGTLPASRRYERERRRFHPGKPVRVRTYAHVMREEAGIDVEACLGAEDGPARIAALQAQGLRRPGPGWSADDMLAACFLERVERNLGWNGPDAITHYPATQCALARLDPADPRVVLRAEVFLAGVELANGYDELVDAHAIKRRMSQWNLQRRADGLAPHPPDPGFAAALRAGLPPCAGMALGVDRLLMLLWGAPDVASVRLGPPRRAPRRPPRGV